MPECPAQAAQPALKPFCLTLAILFLVESPHPYCLIDFLENLSFTQQIVLGPVLDSRIVVDWIVRPACILLGK